jgi:hypothetical protein
MMHDPLDSEFWRQTVGLEMDLLTLMCMHGCLALALKHPDALKGPIRAKMVDLVDVMLDELVRRGAIDRADVEAGR